MALVELNVTLICPTQGTRAWKDAIGCDVAAESLSRALSHWIGSPWGSLLAVLKPTTELPQILQGYTMQSDSENKSYHSLWHEENMSLTASGYNTLSLYEKKRSSYSILWFALISVLLSGWCQEKSTSVTVTQLTSPPPTPS